MSRQVAGSCQRVLSCAMTPGAAGDAIVSLDVAVAREQPAALHVRAPADHRGGGDQQRDPGQRDAEDGAGEDGGQRDRE